MTPFRLDGYIEIREIYMRHGVLSRHSLYWIAYQEPLQQVAAFGCQLGCHLGERHAGMIHREWFEVWEKVHTRPGIFSRGAKKFEDSFELVINI